MRSRSLFGTPVRKNLVFSAFENFSTSGSPLGRMTVSNLPEVTGVLRFMVARLMDCGLAHRNSNALPAESNNLQIGERIVVFLECKAVFRSNLIEYTSSLIVGKSRILRRVLKKRAVEIKTYSHGSVEPFWGSI